MAAFLQDLWWPRWEWVREVFVMLAEYEWVSVHSQKGLPSGANPGLSRPWDSLAGFRVFGLRP